MAITSVIEPTVSETSGVATQFTTTAPFMLYGDNFGGLEACELLRLGPSGEYHPVIVGGQSLKVSVYGSNSIFVDAFGTFRLRKSVTSLAASVGYEEQ